MTVCCSMRLLQPKTEEQIIQRDYLENVIINKNYAMFTSPFDQNVGKVQLAKPQTMRPQGTPFI